jgi:hypothetical protein
MGVGAQKRSDPSGDPSDPLTGYFLFYFPYFWTLGFSTSFQASKKTPNFPSALFSNRYQQFL